MTLNLAPDILDKKKLERDRRSSVEVLKDARTAEEGEWHDERICSGTLVLTCVLVLEVVPDYFLRSRQIYLRLFPGFRRPLYCDSLFRPFVQGLRIVNSEMLFFFFNT